MAKFFICEHCKNQVDMIYSSGVPMICCGQPMTELVPNTVEASAEKHLPDVRTEDARVLVRVGSAPHPMLPEHHIAWVVLETTVGIYRKPLPLDGPPEVVFTIGEETPVAVYAYCNIHGLWKTAL